MKNLNRVNDLTGRQFGRLKVIGIDDSKNTRRTFWICQCSCGNVTSSRSDALLSGAKKSCGCLKAERSAENVSKNHKHKKSGTRIYQIWQGMKGRCYNEHDPRYCRYGGRGIEVCEEWRNDFIRFYEWAVANGYSEKLTIDRIDNDGSYTPENCRWADHVTQCNNRSTNIHIKIGNSLRTLTEWCKIFELDYNRINARYNRNPNISIEELFNK